MQGLAKENCFNTLREKYPHAHHLFLSWIDDQKIGIRWDNYFNANLTYHAGGEDAYSGKLCRSVAPKFHDLPLELQFGLICKFIQKCYPNQSVMFHMNTKDIYNTLTGAYAVLNSKIVAGELDWK